MGPVVVLGFLTALLFEFNAVIGCTTPKWHQVSGGLKHVSVAQDGTVWGVNSNDDIFRRDGNSWTHIGGKLKQISAGGHDKVWGVNSNDDIFYRNNNGWTHVGGKLKHVSVGGDGKVWGVNSNDDIFRRDGNSWTHIGGKLKQISVGNANHVWGVNTHDDIYKRTGDHWTHIGGKLKYVSVANDGTVWGVNTHDSIYLRTGNSWTHYCGGLKQISSGHHAGSHWSVWGVNSAGNIYDWDTIEQHNDAKKIIDQQFHSKHNREWIESGSTAHYKRYECKQVYCTTDGAKKCWHISVHIHPNAERSSDRIYAFEYEGSNAAGYHEVIGKWSYNLPNQEGLTRPS